MTDIPEMQYRTLGRTGLRVSRVGLGSGGPSRLGLWRGGDDALVEHVIKQAVDLGINLIDTSRNYGTEEAIGAALRSVVDEVYVATKIWCYPEDARGDPKLLITDPQHAIDSVELSLRALRRDVIDILQLHGVTAGDLDVFMDTIVPVMQRLVEQGKVRFLGISENPTTEHEQEVAIRTCTSGIFDTLMIHYSIFDQEAERRTFPLTREHDVGVFCMSAVRNTFRSSENVQRTLEHLFPGQEESLAFLLQEPVRNYADAAYKFAAAQEDIHVILVGTGNPQHLVESTAAILGDPLPVEHTKVLKEQFGHVDGSVMFADG
jgi:aryl-alcohol dehydrogenase-like predicted oxidoreductase